MSPQQEEVITAFRAAAERFASGGDGRAVRMVHLLEPEVRKTLSTADAQPAAPTKPAAPAKRTRRAAPRKAPARKAVGKDA